MFCCGGKDVNHIANHGAYDVSGPSQDQDFPQYQKLWNGRTYTLLGSGIKYRKIAFFSIQLYAVALYVEEEVAKEELQRLDKKGFFQDYSVDSLCHGLQQGRFQKLLNIRLLRTVTYSQFTGEIGRDLQPRLDQTGNHDLWLKFTAYFQNKSLRSGSNLLALTLEDAREEGGLYSPETVDFRQVDVDIKFENGQFSAALLDVYLGSGNCVPSARTQWATSARNLLAASF